MKIRKITIKNFRSFKNSTTIDFEENYTILVGKNGVGKTSILEAINLATSFSFVESKIKPDDFNSDTEPIEIEVEFDDYFFLKIADWVKLPSKKIGLLRNTAINLRRAKRFQQFLPQHMLLFLNAIKDTMN